MHIRTWCYAVLCLFLPITLPAQKEHKYLDHALPEAWQENDSDFQQTLPVDDQWWKNFNDPTLDSLIEVAVKQNYSVLMAVDRIAMAKANLRIQQGSYSPTLGLAAGWTRQQRAYKQPAADNNPIQRCRPVYELGNRCIRKHPQPRKGPKGELCSLQRGLQRRDGLPLRPSGIRLHQLAGTATGSGSGQKELPVATGGRQDH